MVVTFSLMQQVLKLVGNHLIGFSCLIWCIRRWKIHTPKLWEGLNVLTWKRGKVLVRIQTGTTCTQSVFTQSQRVCVPQPLRHLEYRVNYCYFGCLYILSYFCAHVYKENVIIRKIIKLQSIHDLLSMYIVPLQIE